jgi:hypothetical protein
VRESSRGQSRLAGAAPGLRFSRTMRPGRGAGNLHRCFRRPAGALPCFASSIRGRRPSALPPATFLRPFRARNADSVWGRHSCLPIVLNLQHSQARMPTPLKNAHAAGKNAHAT